jgi:hypothetical protein
MAEGDIVRRVTITATGQGLDETTHSVESLGKQRNLISEKGQCSMGSQLVF